MARLLLLLALLAVAYLVLRQLRALPPQRRRQAYVKYGLAAALLVTVALAATGRMHWLGAAFTGLLVVLRQLAPVLIRLFPLLASLRGRAAPSAGRTSTVASALLRMQLDHDSGALSGEVLAGEFQGWQLADMDRGQLERLLAFCRTEDQDSAQLLLGYLRQRFAGEAFDGGSGPAPDSGGRMGRAEALAVLGLDEGASTADIQAAHRRLMQKLHPDRGGNDYLAAKVNLARDVLLGQ